MVADYIPEPSADGQPDVSLPNLSVEQASALHDLAERAFNAHGVPVKGDGKGVLRAGSRVYGLLNLSRTVAAAPWEEWPRLVDAHAAAMVSAYIEPAAAETVSPDKWFLKLHLEEDLPEKVDFDARSGFPGVVALPTIDHPDRVVEMYSIKGVREHAELDAFRGRALANLQSLPAPQITALHEGDADPDEWVFALRSVEVSDSYGAARALVVDHVLRTFLGVDRAPHGCVVAIPHRDLLLVHVVGGKGVFAAIQQMVSVTNHEHGNGPGPISPELYYVSSTGYADQLTQHEDTEIQINVAGAFARALGDLGLVEKG